MQYLILRHETDMHNVKLICRSQDQFYNFQSFRCTLPVNIYLDFPLHLINSLVKIFEKVEAQIEFNLFFPNFIDRGLTALKYLVVQNIEAIGSLKEGSLKLQEELRIINYYMNLNFPKLCSRTINSKLL